MRQRCQLIATGADPVEGAACAGPDHPMDPVGQRHRRSRSGPHPRRVQGARSCRARLLGLQEAPGFRTFRHHGLATNGMRPSTLWPSAPRPAMRARPRASAAGRGPAAPPGRHRVLLLCAVARSRRRVVRAQPMVRYGAAARCCTRGRFVDGHAVGRSTGQRSGRHPHERRAIHGLASGGPRMDKRPPGPPLAILRGGGWGPGVSGQVLGDTRGSGDDAPAWWRFEVTRRGSLMAPWQLGGVVLSAGPAVLRSLQPRLPRERANVVRDDDMQAPVRTSCGDGLVHDWNHSPNAIRAATAI